MYGSDVNSGPPELLKARLTDAPNPLAAEPSAPRIGGRPIMRDTHPAIITDAE